MKFRAKILKFKSQINGGNQHFMTTKLFAGCVVFLKKSSTVMQRVVVSACHVSCCDTEMVLMDG
jgi:hypothetical protein